MFPRFPGGIISRISSTVRGGGRDWAVNADGVLAPVVSAPVSFPQTRLSPFRAELLVGDVNDWDPTGVGSLPLGTIDLQTVLNVERRISGIIAPVLTGATPAGQFPEIRLVNFTVAGIGEFVLLNNSPLSAPGNRFVVAGFQGTDLRLMPGNEVTLHYDTTSAIWQVLPVNVGNVRVAAVTTDAVATSIYTTAPLLDGRCRTLTAKLTCSRTDGGFEGADRAGYQRRATFFRDGAAATAQEGATQTGYTRESVAGLDVTFLVNGDDSVSVQVTGIAAQTFKWRGVVYSEDTP